MAAPGGAHRALSSALVSSKPYPTVVHRFMYNSALELDTIDAKVEVKLHCLYVLVEIQGWRFTGRFPVSQDSGVERPRNNDNIKLDPDAALVEDLLLPLNDIYPSSPSAVSSVLVLQTLQSHVRRRR